MSNTIKRFTPKQQNALVDDAVRGIYIPLNQGAVFERALFELANNPQRTEEDIARVRDMTKYNWRDAKAQARTPQPVEFTATHVTGDNKLAVEIREGVYLLEKALPVSDIDARRRNLNLRSIHDERKFQVTHGQIQAALAFKHPLHAN